jgi:tetratricopeptide (TPR) repeat protein
VHPLVAETTRQRAGVALITSFGQAAELLNAVTTRLADDDPPDRESWLAVLPHLRFLFSVDARVDSKVLVALGETAARTSQALSWAGLFPAALEIADAALGRLTSLDQDGTIVVRLRFQRAMADYYLGHYADAETEQRRVLSVRQQDLGDDHQDSLTTQHYIATAQAKQGRLAEADMLFRQVLNKRLETLGPEHAHTLATRHWIAAVAALQGMPEQAEAQSRDVLDARRRTLGAEHPSTLATSHDIARYLADQGKYTQAETRFRQVLATRSRVLGLEHPRTLETQYEIASSLANQGRLHDARSMLEQTMRTQIEILGPNHPETVRTATLIERVQSQESQETIKRKGDSGYVTAIPQSDRRCSRTSGHAALSVPPDGPPARRLLKRSPTKAADADAADEPGRVGSTRGSSTISIAASPSVTESLEENARRAGVRCG